MNRWSWWSSEREIDSYDQSRQEQIRLWHVSGFKQLSLMFLHHHCHQLMFQEWQFLTFIDILIWLSFGFCLQVSAAGRVIWFDLTATFCFYNTCLLDISILDYPFNIYIYFIYFVLTLSAVLYPSPILWISLWLHKRFCAITFQLIVWILFVEFFG